MGQLERVQCPIRPEGEFINPLDEGTKALCNLRAAPASIYIFGPLLAVEQCIFLSLMSGLLELIAFSIF